MSFKSLGLGLSTATSLSNVALDVSRKKALQGVTLLRTTFYLRVASAAFLTFMVLGRWLAGHAPHFWPASVAPSSLAFLPPSVLFFAFLILDVALVAWSVVLFNRAMQIAPLSLTIPFLSFTPVFLMGTAAVILGEFPNRSQAEGVAFVVLGSLLMHRRAFRNGIAAPLKAVLYERGSRYMLLVSLLQAVSNPLEKKLVQLSDSYTFSWVYSVALVVIFAVPMLLHSSRGQLPAEKVRTLWIATSGLVDAGTLLLQLLSLRFADVVIVIALKRAGILLTVLAGWLIFHEKDVGDRLIAAAVMAIGAVMVYIPISGRIQMLVTPVTLIGLAAALLLTRRPGESARPGVPTT